MKARDNFDGTATITYVRVAAPCFDGSPCGETLHPHERHHRAPIPLRVDSSLFDLGATVTEARLVRIQ